jgi:hypothetical protein
MRIDIDTSSCYFCAPESNLAKISQQAKQIIGRATRNARSLPVKDLQSPAGHAEYVFLAVPPAKLFPRELHSVVGKKWGGFARITPQLHHDM